MTYDEFERAVERVIEADNREDFFLVSRDTREVAEALVRAAYGLKSNPLPEPMKRFVETGPFRAGCAPLAGRICVDVHGEWSPDTVRDIAAWMTQWADYMAQINEQAGTPRAGSAVTITDILALTDALGAVEFWIHPLFKLPYPWPDESYYAMSATNYNAWWWDEGIQYVTSYELDTTTEVRG